MARLSDCKQTSALRAVVVHVFKSGDAECAAPEAWKDAKHEAACDTGGPNSDAIYGLNLSETTLMAEHASHLNWHHWFSKDYPRVSRHRRNRLSLRHHRLRCKLLNWLRGSWIDWVLHNAMLLLGWNGWWISIGVVVALNWLSFRYHMIMVLAHAFLWSWRMIDHFIILRQGLILIVRILLIRIHSIQL